ncbi:hypothetical protein HN681_04785 [archaeon]|jgi:hypothetical protein|nr:hypothetical protein [archaeon]MBT3731024.1 hypothetical protein [archaeon]MBT4669738.1 hypothetical protein [archaeon]MBT5029888.1 hypothetical protein [archaeon]MBT5288460.1 hypothetical protein [archaeon]
MENVLEKSNICYSLIKELETKFEKKSLEEIKEGLYSLKNPEIEQLFSLFKDIIKEAEPWMDEKGKNISNNSKFIKSKKIVLIAIAKLSQFIAEREKQGNVRGDSIEGHSYTISNIKFNLQKIQTLWMENQ